MYLPLFASSVCYALLCVHSSFAIILKRKLIALLLLSCRRIVTILFFTVPWVRLQYVIVVFPDHTHFLVYTSVLQYQETQAVSEGVHCARIEDASSWYVNKAIHDFRPE